MHGYSGLSVGSTCTLWGASSCGIGGVGAWPGDSGALVVGFLRGRQMSCFSLACMELTDSWKQGWKEGLGTAQGKPGSRACCACSCSR